VSEILAMLGSDENLELEESMKGGIDTQIYEHRSNRGVENPCGVLNPVVTQERRAKRKEEFLVLFDKYQMK